MLIRVDNFEMNFASKMNERIRKRLEEQDSERKEEITRQSKRCCVNIFVISVMKVSTVLAEYFLGQPISAENILCLVSYATMVYAVLSVI